MPAVAKRKRQVSRPGNKPGGKPKPIKLPPDVAVDVHMTMHRIRQAIRRRRQDLGLRIEDLAERINHKKEHVQSLEAGNRPINLSLLIWIAKALDTTVVALWMNHFGKPSNDPVRPKSKY